MDATDRSGMMIPEALADRAAELAALIDWAQARLARARGLAALATEPARPGGKPFLYRSAAALDLAGELLMEVGDQAGDAKSPHVGEGEDVESLALRAQQAEGAARGDEWTLDRVVRMTVADLAEALGAVATA
jgi:hypothetical protein